MYLSPLGAGTLEQVIIRPEILTDQVNRFIAEITDKMNLSVIKSGQRNLTHVWRRQVEVTAISGRSYQLLPSFVASANGSSFCC